MLCARVQVLCARVQVLWARVQVLAQSMQECKHWSEEQALENCLQSSGRGLFTGSAPPPFTGDDKWASVALVGTKNCPVAHQEIS